MRISLDPWGGDYGSQISTSQAVDEEQLSAQVTGQQVEAGAWQPRTPTPENMPNMTVVIDGVMRVDAPAVLSDAESRFLALFGSYAAGAVVIDRRVEIIERTARPPFYCRREAIRTGCDGCGRDGWKDSDALPECQCLRPGAGRVTRKPDDPDATGEIDVARKLSGDERLILADGNLTF